MIWKHQDFSIGRQQIHASSHSSCFEWTKRWTASPAKQHQASQDGLSLANHGTALTATLSQPPMKRQTLVQMGGERQIGNTGRWAAQTREQEVM